jgi:hypothetical protein
MGSGFEKAVKWGVVGIFVVIVGAWVWSTANPRSTGPLQDGWDQRR